MTVYDHNIEIIKTYRQDLYEGIRAVSQQGLSDHEQILVGDAYNGEKFLAIMRGDDITALNSTYHPSYEASRYELQFHNNLPSNSTVLLFGLGNGKVVEDIITEIPLIRTCIVYEPSVQIFMKALEEYDLRSILGSMKLMIFVEGINSREFEHFLEEVIDYESWRHFYLYALPMYPALYPTLYQSVNEVYYKIQNHKRMELNTLLKHAKSSMSNVITAMKWMIDSRTYGAMKGRIPTDIPCIIVAAGPSLEKNVDVLKRAKGRAFILCVDSANAFLLDRDIIPDMVCTMDAKKGKKYFSNPKIKEVPLAISNDTDMNVLNMMGEIHPFYMSVSSDYYEKLYGDQGADITYMEGGGSVATICFQMAVELGFHTIILIGQDLAFTDDKRHAGRGAATQFDLTRMSVAMVDGYDGGQVLTRADYKGYIDWFVAHIQSLPDHTVINATEGGAKIQGAIQMTLEEAVRTYCEKEYNLEEILDAIPQVWETADEKRDFYRNVKQKYQYFQGFKRRLTDAVSDAERAIHILQRGNYDIKELKAIDAKLKAVTNEVYQ